MHLRYQLRVKARTDNNLCATICLLCSSGTPAVLSPIVRPSSRYLQEKKPPSYFHHSRFLRTVCLLPPCDCFCTVLACPILDFRSHTTTVSLCCLCFSRILMEITLYMSKAPKAFLCFVHRVLRCMVLEYVLVYTSKVYVIVLAESAARCFHRSSSLQPLISLSLTKTLSPLPLLFAWSLGAPAPYLSSSISLSCSHESHVSPRNF